LGTVVPRSAKSSTSHDKAKQHLFLKKEEKKKENPKEKDPRCSQELLNRNSDEFRLLWEFGTDTTGLVT